MRFQDERAADKHMMDAQGKAVIVARPPDPCNRGEKNRGDAAFMSAARKSQAAEGQGQLRIAFLVIFVKPPGQMVQRSQIPYAWRLYPKTRNHGKGMLEVS